MLHAAQLGHGLTRVCTVRKPFQAALLGQVCSVLSVPRARSGDDPNLDDAQPVNEIFVVVTGCETSASGKGVVPTNGTPAVRGGAALAPSSK